ncbi:ATP-binding cassette domain-containing protein [[Clostridium] scindens]|uniref:ATP-binding cassette domain-containing protein n=1 Tax=Clostridium scindens (strain JCM 10418 / VPI 12708) TaxID=29347 RepID=UPI001FC7E41F|nr:ATP-binding cassette domain-containing protein [[Clostridium] scindens]
MMDIIVDNVSKSYGEQVVLKKLTVRFPGEKISCIMGPSGCGKTTLMRILLGLERADEGRVEGVPYGKISAVFQEDRLCENVSAIRNLKLVSEKDEAELRREMEALRLGEAFGKPVRELSGGMKRRVAILRALLAPCGCIMMDEPLKGLDEETKIVTAGYIRKNAKEKTLIVITHDRQDLELLGADKLLTLA